MEGILVLLSLTIFVGSICGLFAIYRTGTLRQRLDKAETEMAALRHQVHSLLGDAAANSRPDGTTPLRRPQDSPATVEPRLESTPLPQPQLQPKARTSKPVPAMPDGPAFHERVRDNWMVWLGGFCVALAGIFLARYTIELGLLGPKARIAMGILTGLSLHAGAEYLRRRTHESHPAFAAMAGGGSITLFAALLASLHIYQQISPATAFVAMAAIALATMALARLHGPALAAIGILGAYLVPVLVSSGEDRVLVALTYAWVISASALLLLRYVYRSWLWWGFVVGAFFWWGATLFHHDADGFRGLYLAAIGFVALAIPHFDWMLRRSVSLPAEKPGFSLNFSTLPGPEPLSIALVILLIFAQGISIFVEDRFVHAWLWVPLIVLVFQASRFRETMTWMPALLLVVQGLAFLALRLERHNGHFEFKLLSSPDDVAFLWFLAGIAALYSFLSLRNLAYCRLKAVWSALASLTPILCLATGYLLTSHLVSWTWGVGTLLVALAYLAIASSARKRSSPESLVVWLFFGGHFALSLAAVMVLDEGTLTLAIATQVISAAWIIRTFQLPSLGWVLKLIVTIVIVRLTLNPWLASYPPGLQWPLWTYGGATICCALGSVGLRNWPALARWGEGATLHLFVLTLWAELRYLIHDGDVFAAGVTATEVAIYVSLFGLLSIVYYRRSLASESLVWLYRTYAYLLAAAAMLSYGLIIGATLMSNPWLWRHVSETPVFNLTILLYLAPVLVGLATYYLHDPRARKVALLITGIAGFVYISMQIRHLFQGTIRLDTTFPDSELYTYSIVWLGMAVAAILGGAWRYGNGCYRAGMVLLTLVIAKLFLVDMSDLGGLYRVASFMGLGLSLLGVSYLHQRLRRIDPHPTEGRG